MSLFGDKKEIKSLSFLKGVEAKDITAEQVDALNSELKALGFTGIEVSISGTIAKMQSDLESKSTELTTASENLNTANQTIAEQNEKIKTLGGQPAAEPVNKGSKEDVITTSNDEKPWETISKKVLDEKLF